MKVEGSGGKREKKEDRAGYSPIRSGKKRKGQEKEKARETGGMGVGGGALISLKRHVQNVTQMPRRLRTLSIKLLLAADPGAVRATHFTP